METKDRDKIRAAAENSGDILFKWLKKAYEMGVKRDRFSDQQSECDLPALDLEYVPQMQKELPLTDTIIALLNALDEAEKKKLEKGLANVALVRKIKEAEKDNREICSMMDTVKESTFEILAEKRLAEAENTQLKELINEGYVFLVQEKTRIRGSVPKMSPYELWLKKMIAEAKKA